MSEIGIPWLDNAHTRVGRDICSRAEPYARYDHIVSKIDMSKLNDTERKFVTESVQQKIIWGRPLSDKQAAWMRAIMRKYPRRDEIPEFRWR